MSSVQARHSCNWGGRTTPLIASWGRPAATARRSPMARAAPIFDQDRQSATSTGSGGFRASSFPRPRAPSRGQCRGPRTSSTASPMATATTFSSDPLEELNRDDRRVLWRRPSNTWTFCSSGSEAIESCLKDRAAISRRAGGKPERCPLSSPRERSLARQTRWGALSISGFLDRRRRVRKAPPGTGQPALPHQHLPAAGGRLPGKTSPAFLRPGVGGGRSCVWDRREGSRLSSSSRVVGAAGGCRFPAPAQPMPQRVREICDRPWCADDRRRGGDVRRRPAPVTWARPAA